MAINVLTGCKKKLGVATEPIPAQSVLSLRIEVGETKTVNEHWGEL